MVAWVLAGARAQPLVLAFEDLHWADPTSLDLLKMLAERGATAPLMIVATARPEFRAPWVTRSHHGIISLVPLDRQQVRQMVGSIAERYAFSADALEGVAVRTGGVPLFIEEVTRLMLEGGAQAIPPTLQQSLAARLDRLGEAREVAQMGAVVGREFRFGLLHAIAGAPEAELNVALEKLVDADLLFVDGVAPDSSYRFKHALIQEAAYESMLRSRRREIHAEIAEALVRLQPAIVETAPETVATHLARAGDEAGAAEYWQKAGQLAQRNSAYREAIGAYQNALRHMSKQDRAFVDVNRAVASAYFAAGEHELNLKHLAEAAGAAEAGGDPVTVTEIVTQQCHVFSQFGDDAEQAVHVGRRALEMANRLEDEGLAYGARFALGHACWISGDYDSAIELLSANLPENYGRSDADSRLRHGGVVAPGFTVDSWIDARESRPFRPSLSDSGARASPPAKERLRRVRHRLSSCSSPLDPRRHSFGDADIAGSHRARDSSWTRVFTALATGHAGARICARRGI